VLGDLASLEGGALAIPASTTFGLVVLRPAG
jgi:hypothetical protein